MPWPWEPHRLTPQLSWSLEPAEPGMNKIDKFKGTKPMKGRTACRIHQGWALPGCLLLGVCLLLGGCIRSRVQITSEPNGAEVIWRGQPYGATPVTIPFIWYWYYDFALEKPGYHRTEVFERFRTPPWFLIPMDLFVELLPIPIHDTRHRHYELEPLEPTVSQIR